MTGYSHTLTCNRFFDVSDREGDPTRRTRSGNPTRFPEVGHYDFLSAKGRVLPSQCQRVRHIPGDDTPVTPTGWSPGIDYHEDRSSRHTIRSNDIGP